MSRPVLRILGAGTLLFAFVACSDSTAPTSPLTLAALRAALSSVPVGFGDLSTSYVGAQAAMGANAGLWLGGGRDASFDRGNLMGGGLQDAYIGGIGFPDKRGHHGPFGGGPSSVALAASSC